MAYSASGCLSGAASANAFISLAAASAFSRRGKADTSTPKRRALPSCGTRQRSASVGLVAEAERAGLARDQRFAGGQALAVGPGRPFRHFLFGHAELAQPGQNLEILHRMRIAGERHGERAHFGAAQRVLWQQRRVGMGLVQPFDDGERLGQRRAVVTLQRRHQPLRVDREIGGRALFALAKVMRQVIGRQSLEVQRDPDPVCRGAAEIAMQLHRNLPRILSFASGGRH